MRVRSRRTVLALSCNDVDGGASGPAESSGPHSRAVSVRGCSCTSTGHLYSPLLNAPHAPAARAPACALARSRSPLLLAQRSAEASRRFSALHSRVGCSTICGWTHSGTAKLLLAAGRAGSPRARAARAALPAAPGLAPGPSWRRPPCARGRAPARRSRRPPPRREARACAASGPLPPLTPCRA